MPVVTGRTPVNVGVDTLDLRTDLDTLARKVTSGKALSGLGPEVVELVTLLFGDEVCRDGVEVVFFILSFF